jgi:23S rRNA pseudouridine1911/1915/1917 synthase
MNVLYEDNHIIIINKAAGEIVQGDKTGDKSLCDKMKAYLKEKYAKPGNVFVGLPHRLDRPVSGIVVLAKTSKALERLNNMFRDGNVKKIYWAITKERPAVSEGELSGWILRNEKMNKSFCYDKEVQGSKHALLYYRHIAESQNYNLIEVELKTGRHHQIRCQLAHMGCPIKGDLKYGARRSNPDGSISLHARYIEFIHPVSKESIQITAPLPADRLWQSFEK